MLLCASLFTALLCCRSRWYGSLQQYRSTVDNVLCSVNDLFVDIEFYSGVDPSALMIFAAVCDDPCSGVDLISVDDLIKRCSTRLYLQRCCTADRGGNTYQHDSSAVRSIRFTTLFAVVLIYSLTTYFAAVCCRSQR